MSVVEVPAPTKTGFRVVVRLALIGDDADVEEFVQGLERRTAWMNSARQRFGEVQLAHDLAADSTSVFITATPARRSNVRSPAAARHMVEAALSNEMRSTDDVHVEHIYTRSQEIS